jgi:TonB family protein
MRWLSLDEPVPEPSARLSRSDAVLISLGLHLAVLLLALFLPRHLPESILAFFRARPAPVTVAQMRPVPPRATREAPLRQPRMPLQFTYVKVPNDTASAPNPDARLFSDKNRRARQEMPTPPEARRFSRDPHSVGDSIDRVKPDANRPAGPESPETPPPRAGGGRGGPSAGTADRARSPIPQRGAPAPPAPPGGEGPSAAAGGGAGEEALVPRPGSGPGEGGGEGPAPDLKRTLREMQAGEYKFTFNNPAYLRDGSYGTMSFDTQGYPWGDYARRLYLVIRNSWYARIPLAAREGIRGYVCWHFVIEKDGTVSRADLLRPSSVPPFDRAAEDAIHAASPVPPLPADFPEPREGVTFCFYYNMAPGEDD